MKKLLLAAGDTAAAVAYALLPAVGVALLVAMGIALAQTPGAGVPGLFITSPTGNEQINVYGGGPQVTTVYLRQLRDAPGYSKQTPSTGFSLSFASGASYMQIGGGSTLATGTITLTTSPVDGQLNCFYTKPVVTALTLSVVAGQTLNDAVTATSATTSYCYLYTLSSKTWDRVQ